MLIKGALAKSGSESSLSESENIKEASRSHEEKEECSENESSNGYGNKLSPQSNTSSAVVLRRKSRGNPLFRKSEGGGRADSEGTQMRYVQIYFPVFYQPIFFQKVDLFLVLSFFLVNLRAILRIAKVH